MTDNNGLSASGSKKGKLQRIILKMLRAREYQPDGLPTNTRFIYYELVQTGIVPKPRKEGAIAQPEHCLARILVGAELHGGRDRAE